MSRAVSLTKLKKEFVGNQTLFYYESRLPFSILVTGQRVILQFANMEKGIYRADLFNNDGQKIYSGTINHGGGSASETLQLPTNIAIGVYPTKTQRPQRKILCGLCVFVG